MAIAAMAASAEEFWFRLFAIPLLGRFVRWRWLAIVIPAFVWGFLHATYPQQPGYIRGIEVGLIGVAAGFLMTRFGIVATLVWHYTVDAGLIGSFLLQADGWDIPDQRVAGGRTGRSSASRILGPLQAQRRLSLGRRASQRRCRRSRNRPAHRTSAVLRSAVRAGAALALVVDRGDPRAPGRPSCPSNNLR